MKQRLALCFFIIIIITIVVIIFVIIIIVVIKLLIHIITTIIVNRNPLLQIWKNKIAHQRNDLLFCRFADVHVSEKYILGQLSSKFLI